jgi:phage FluMu protein Com
MDIEFDCEQCGQHLAIEEAGAGLTIQCPKCKQSLTVPSPKKIKFRCGKCGRLLQCDEGFAGEAFQCPKCHESLTVPASDVAERQTAATTSSQNDATYYVALNGEARGPYTVPQLAAMLNAGDLTGNTPCCQQGDSDWKPIASVLPAAVPKPSPPPPQQKRTSQVLMRAVGVAGSVELYDHKVVIRREGALAFMTHGLAGNKEILLSQISAIQLKSANLLTNGYIQFSFVGGQETKGGLWDATGDENTVLFRESHQAEFEAFKEAVEERLIAIRSPASHAPAALSPVEELEKLARLRDRGIVTEEEFQAKKRQLLGL